MELFTPLFLDAPAVLRENVGADVIAHVSRCDYKRLSLDARTCYTTTASYSVMSPTWSIRPATINDRPALSRICLLTGDAGQSGEGQYTLPEMLGLVYAEPYVVVPPNFGFLLVSTDSNGEETVLGYVLGTPDTRVFEAGLEETWYKDLRPKYPKDPYPPNATPADKHMIGLVHKPDTTPQETINMSRAHIHIDLLPPAQGQGWGPKLIGKAIEHLKNQGCDSLFVGIGGSVCSISVLREADALGRFA